MITREILSRMKKVARPLGFSAKGTVFWLWTDEFVCAVHLQKSSWGLGWYLNFHASPRMYVGDEATLTNSSLGWPFGGRMEDYAPAEVYIIIKFLETEEANHADVSTVDPVLEWMFPFAADLFTDAEKVRTAIIEQDVNHPLGATARLGGPWAFTDWARRTGAVHRLRDYEWLPPHLRPTPKKRRHKNSDPDE